MRADPPCMRPLRPSRLGHHALCTIHVVVAVLMLADSAANAPLVAVTGALLQRQLARPRLTAIGRAGDGIWRLRTARGPVDASAQACDWHTATACAAHFATGGGTLHVVFWRDAFRSEADWRWLHRSLLRDLEPGLLEPGGAGARGRVVSDP